MLLRYTKCDYIADSIDIKHACVAGRIPAIRTPWQEYSSSFEVRLYIKVTFQPVGPNFLFWPAWILHMYGGEFPNLFSGCVCIFKFLLAEN